MVGPEEQCKKKIALYKKERERTGGGPLTLVPTEQEFRIINLIGEESVSGIPGANIVQDWTGQSEVVETSISAVSGSGCK